MKQAKNIVIGLIAATFLVSAVPASALTNVATMSKVSAELLEIICDSLYQRIDANVVGYRRDDSAADFDPEAARFPVQRFELQIGVDGKGP